MRAAVPDVAGSDRGQGLAQPESRVAAGPRPRSAERDELGCGVFTALFLAADLLRRTVVKTVPSGRSFTVRAVARPAYTAFVAALWGSFIPVRCPWRNALPAHTPQPRRTRTVQWRRSSLFFSLDSSHSV